MNTNQYTQKTLEALQAAQQLAVEYQHNALEPEHLLHALASQEQGLIPQLLQKLNVDPGSFAAAVAEKLSALPRVSGSGRDPGHVLVLGELRYLLFCKICHCVPNLSRPVFGYILAHLPPPRKCPRFGIFPLSAVQLLGTHLSPRVHFHGYSLYCQPARRSLPARGTPHP